MWRRLIGGFDGKIRNGIKVFLDTNPPVYFLNDDQTQGGIQSKRDRKQNGGENYGVENIDVGYSGFKHHVEKSLFLFAEGEAHSCAVCAERLGSPTSTALVCPRQGCRTVSHMACLSDRFLDEEGVSGSVVPISGSCPQCKSILQWMDLVKEMSLRVRGEGEVTRLMKRPRVRKTKVMKDVASPQADGFTENTEDESDGADDDLAADTAPTRHESEEPLAADWYHLVDDEEDVMAVTSVDSEHSNYLGALSPTGSKLPAQKLEVVIEDSDWSNAEVLD